jgi:hypothetical protein
MDLFQNRAQLGAASKAALDFDTARRWYQEAQSDLSRFQERGWIRKPDDMIGTQSLQQWSEQISKQLATCAKAPQAIADLDFALNQPEPEIPGLLDARLRVLAKKGDGDGCLATAEAMTKIAAKDADALCATARLWSLTADLTTERKKERAQKAFDFLHKVIAAGYKDLSDLKTSKDWGPVRDRDVFKKLIAEMEAAAWDGKKAVAPDVPQPVKP